MATTALTLDEIYALAHDAMTANGCNDENASALADIVTRAERDGSHSHGLFRIPGYVKALRSGKVDGKASPTVTRVTPAVIRCEGHGCFAPLAQASALPVLAEAASEVGVAALSLTGIHHFAALWPETEFLADRGLVGIACTAYMPMVAPAGSAEKLFGTNPISFAWPRPGRDPVCYDMATAAMAMGDIQIAARDGKEVPPGTGLDADGNATTDPAKITAGVVLPFGGYKGSAIALMVELLAAAWRRDGDRAVTRANRRPRMAGACRGFHGQADIAEGCAGTGRTPPQEPPRHRTAQYQRGTCRNNPRASLA